MKARELMNKTPDELRREIVELRQEWRTLRFKIGARQAAKTHRLGQIRRDVARLQNALRAQPTP
jgi:large subunit ribosomal protein L29